jgi:RNA recognition motif-containing protein
MVREVRSLFGMNIYVGNLPFRVDDDELRQIFEAYGEVTSTSVINDKITGRSRGFGFVEMPVDSEAEEAIKKLDGANIKGRVLKVNQARPRNDNFSSRPPRDRGRY